MVFTSPPHPWPLFQFPLPLQGTCLQLSGSWSFVFINLGDWVLGQDHHCSIWTVGLVAGEMVDGQVWLQILAVVSLLGLWAENLAFLSLSFPFWKTMSVLALLGD